MVRDRTQEPQILDGEAKRVQAGAGDARVDPGPRAAAIGVIVAMATDANEQVYEGSNPTIEALHALHERRPPGADGCYFSAWHSGASSVSWLSRRLAETSGYSLQTPTPTRRPDHDRQAPPRLRDQPTNADAGTAPAQTLTWIRPMRIRAH